MSILPQPRFRLYGSSANYAIIARNLARRHSEADEAKVRHAERAVAEFVGAAEAVAMPQARVGIYMALKALIRPGQEVVLSPYTIHEVINMVICAGGKPVFADIERDTCNVDAREVEALTTEKTAAVLVTHLHGLACDIEHIRDFCHSRGVPLVEDCAQAFGCTVAGQRVGTFGQAGIYSFGMAKNVNAFFGGMLVTDDHDLANRLRKEMSSWPYFDKRTLVERAAFCLAGDVATSRPIFWMGPYWAFRYGALHNVKALNNQLRGEAEPVRKDHIPESYLRRLRPAQAQLVRRQIEKVDALSAIRRGYAELYHEHLCDLPDVIIPPLRLDGSHIYQTFPIQVPDRQALLRYLTLNLRDLTIQHLRNTAGAPCYGEFNRSCPNAAATADSVLLLPTYPSYGRSNVERNIKLIRAYFDASRRAGKRSKQTSATGYDRRALVEEGQTLLSYLGIEAPGPGPIKRYVKGVQNSGDAVPLDLPRCVHRSPHLLRLFEPPFDARCRLNRRIYLASLVVETEPAGAARLYAYEADGRLPTMMRLLRLAFAEVILFPPRLVAKWVWSY